MLRAVWLAAACVGSAALAQDAYTLKADGKTFRLDGIDAPEPDQSCYGKDGALYPCGRTAAQELEKFIAGRQVLCEDMGPDPRYKKRRLGRCSVGETDLQQWLVQKGWALGIDRTAKSAFALDEDTARGRQLGLWNGCFVAPRDFRAWNKRKARLLGPDCAQEARDKLFPVEASKPSGCGIKAQYARRALPYRGVYHLPGCRSYQPVKAKRWFCSEDAAQAAGFRKALTCT